MLLWLTALALANGPDSAQASEPDWHNVVTARAEQTEHGTVVVVSIAEGFHVYGKRERNARPLEVWVDDRKVRADVPPGRAVNSGETRSYWLEGTVEVPFKQDADAGIIRYQACNASLCGPPSELYWQTE